MNIAQSYKCKYENNSKSRGRDKGTSPPELRKAKIYLQNKIYEVKTIIELVIGYVHVSNVQLFAHCVSRWILQVLLNQSVYMYNTFTLACQCLFMCVF